MLHFHSYWTRPVRLEPLAQPDELIEVWEFEALTWLLSALEIRKHSPIRLITDTRGLKFVRNTGLEWLYNGGITTALDGIPQGIDPQLFWAAGKLYSWLGIDEPAVSVDTDAVLWAPIQVTSPVMALHMETRDWPWYARNQADFASFGFEGSEWDWSSHPLNHGVLMIQDTGLMRRYAETAVAFMERYSEHCRALEREGKARPPQQHDAMLFVDQRLLVMCARQSNLAVHPITSLHPEKCCIYRDPKCLHLWMSKGYYRYCAAARVALCNFLIGYLLEHHPESRRTLAQWKLEQPMPLDEKMQLDYRGLEPEDERRTRFSLIKNVDGLVWVLDPNVDVRRKATIGSLVLPGETLLPEAGAHFEVCPASTEDSQRERT
jgi:hypothetical protein